jgi:CO/xanthine dehydrogenase FAD-binding subunit
LKVEPMADSFVEPATLYELWDALEREGRKVLVAGGTDWMVGAREEPALRDALWVSLVRIESFRSVVTVGEGIRIGGTATHAELARDALVRAHAQAVSDAASAMASPLVRNRGTLGGNLATASPAGDLIPPLMALGAELRLLSSTGERTVPVEEFFTGVKSTVLCEGEVIAWAEVPVVRGRRSAFVKIGPRRAMTVSKVSVAVSAVVSRGRWSRVRVALGSVAPTVIRSPGAERILEGAEPNDALLAEAGAAAALDSHPIDDFRSTAEYRKRVLPVILMRAASRILQRE